MVILARLVQQEAHRQLRHGLHHEFLQAELVEHIFLREHHLSGHIILQREQVVVGLLLHRRVVGQEGMLVVLVAEVAVLVVVVQVVLVVAAADIDK